MFYTMMITKIFLSINVLFLLGCTPLQQESIRIDYIKPILNWNKPEEPQLHRYTDVEGVDHLWRVNMDTLVFPRDNHLLDQVCYYHGGETWRGGESIKLYVDSKGKKSYVIRRVYPHVLEFKDAYRY